MKIILRTGGNASFPELRACPWRATVANPEGRAASPLRKGIDWGEGSAETDEGGHGAWEPDAVEANHRARTSTSAVLPSPPRRERGGG